MTDMKETTFSRATIVTDQGVVELTKGEPAMRVTEAEWAEFKEKFEHGITLLKQNTCYPTWTLCVAPKYFTECVMRKAELDKLVDRPTKVIEGWNDDEFIFMLGTGEGDDEE